MSKEPRLAKAFKRGWKPPDRRPPWKWAEDNIRVDKTSPFPGKWRSETSPWVRELMEVFADNRVESISVMCSSQSAKTQTIICLLAWAISEDPGPCMWVMAAQDEAKTFAKTRLMPTLEDCAPVAELFPQDRWAKNTLEINFTTMPLIINGANSQSKLQSKPVRWLFLDEVRNYPPGAYELVLERTRSFWNARTVVISTPDVVDDAVDRAFKGGDQRRYHVKCGGCGEANPMTWANLKWDDTPVTRPDGKWNFDALAPTIRYECPKCGAAVKDMADARKRLAASGTWIKSNPGAPARRVSFHWNALLPPWSKWHKLVEKFLNAREALKLGSVEPLKAFINGDLGEPWNEEEHAFVEGAPRAVSTYSFGEVGNTWGDIRFLTVDVQQHELWGVVRGWRRDTAGSRLLWAGKIETFDQVEVLRERYGVKVPRKLKSGRWSRPGVCVDCRYERRTVYRKCAEFKWYAFEGSETEAFPWVRNGKPVYRMYAKPVAQDPGLGSVEQGQARCYLVRFSDAGSQQMLDRLKDGKGAAWEVAQDVPEFYWRQLNAEVLAEFTNKQTGKVEMRYKQIRKDNHLRDCEKMQVVRASMAGILERAEVEGDIEESEDA